MEIKTQIIQLEDYFTVECFDKHGNLKWTDTITNLVVTVGLNDVLNQYLKGSSYTAAHYCGLTASSPTPNAADTMASHSGWTEFTTYTEGTRPSITWGSVSSGSVDNSASKASYTISSDSQTVGGAFICTDSTKSGSSGTLYGVGAFSGGDKTGLDTDDVLNVTVTATAAAS